MRHLRPRALSATEGCSGGPLQLCEFLYRLEGPW